MPQKHSARQTERKTERARSARKPCHVAARFRLFDFLPFRGVAPGFATLGEDPLVVNGSQLSLGLFEDEIG